MNASWLIDRVKNILLDPKSEWPRIAAEPHSSKDVLQNYVVYVAGAAALAAMLSLSGFGPATIGVGILVGLLSFASALAVVFLLGQLADSIAPNFGGQRNAAQGTKLIAYSATAGWVGAILGLLPWIGWLLSLAGVVYGVYLLYLGVPHTTRVPESHATAYTAVLALVWLILAILVAVLTGAIALTGGVLSSLFG